MAFAWLQVIDIQINMKIIIDPRTRISYASYYIEGLGDVFGKSNVLFRMKPFSGLMQSVGEESFDQYFAFVLKEKKGYEKRVVIDYRDKNNLNVDALCWTNVYAKVNFNTKVEEYIQLKQELKDKIIPAGTNFGVRIWDKIHTVRYLVQNYIRSYEYLPVNFRTFLSGYNWQMKRETLDVYEKSDSYPGYVFHVSSLYLNQEHGDVTNKMRSIFVRTCKNNANCTFEGGLLSRSINQSINQYSDVITNKYYPPSVYIQNVKNSAFVFNTPAAWACHGWKLGEYLAMGKAIISTPFVNEMPGKMVHGDNIFFVETEGEMEEAVNRLLSDNSLRIRLEKGAKAYYEKWVKPNMVIQRILQELDNQ